MSGERDKRGALVLYLSYDGLCDPLGASQILPYLAGTARRAHSISVISLEKAERSRAERAAVQKVCDAAGITWVPITYHKRPPLISSMYNLRRLRAVAERIHQARSFDLVHCRSYLPALVGLRMKRRHGVPFVFDMRGFWPDERLEGSGWGRNPLYTKVYRYLKDRERDFWTEAAEIVSLTYAGEEVLRSNGVTTPVTVIPCCVDLDAFQPVLSSDRDAARKRLGFGPHEKVLGYIGSLGGNYMLGAMLDFFNVYRRRHSDARFLFVTHVQEFDIRKEADRRGLPHSAVVVRSARRSDVPRLMAAADHGIAFKRPSFSAKACSPTKLGEMLALGLPVVVNAGVGDVEQVINESGAGAVINRFDDAAYAKAIERLSSSEVERDAVRRWFDLDAAVERYDAIYRRIRRS